MGEDPMSGPDIACDVLIAGAGPVGEVLALLLARQGVDVLILERWAQPYPLPRAVAISHDVLRVLKSLELGPTLDALLEPWGQPGQRFLYQDARGEPLTESRYLPDSESGHPQMCGFSQPELERLLDRRVDAEPLVRQCRGMSLVSWNTDGDWVTALAEPHDGLAAIPGGALRRIRASYLVGCDGANSTVRGLLGIELTDLGFDRDWLVVDVVLGDSAPRLPYASQHLDPARPTTLVPAGPGRRRWEFMVMPSDSEAVLNTDQGAWRLLAPWDVHPGNATLVRRARYTFRARWANRWREHRVVLAGDAAHQMPPFLGQGFNSGIRDAANLAWRLALLVRGLAADSLLDDYATERLGNVRGIVEESARIGELICTIDPVKAELRNAQLRQHRRIGTARVSWPISGGTVHSDGSGGALGPQARVGRGDSDALLDTFLPRPAFVLLGRAEDPAQALTEPTRTAWSTIGGLSAHFGADGLVDRDGTYARWFSNVGAEIALIRPDHHVFGTSTGPESANHLVADLLSQLQPRWADNLSTTG